MQGFGYNKVLFMFMAMFGIWGCFGISEFGRKGDMKLFITTILANLFSLTIMELL